jgi:hypothetical protein
MPFLRNEENLPEGDMATTRQGRPELRSSGREFSPNFAITASDIAVPLCR